MELHDQRKAPPPPSKLTWPVAAAAICRALGALLGSGTREARLCIRLHAVPRCCSRVASSLSRKRALEVLGDVGRILSSSDLDADADSFFWWLAVYPGLCKKIMMAQQRRSRRSRAERRKKQSPRRRKKKEKKEQKRANPPSASKAQRRGQE